MGWSSNGSGLVTATRISDGSAAMVRARRDVARRVDLEKCIFGGGEEGMGFDGRWSRGRMMMKNKRLGRSTLYMISPISLRLTTTFSATKTWVRTLTLVENMKLKVAFSKRGDIFHYHSLRSISVGPRRILDYLFLAQIKPTYSISRNKRISNQTTTSDYGNIKSQNLKALLLEHGLLMRIEYQGLFISAFSRRVGGFDSIRNVYPIGTSWQSG